MLAVISVITIISQTRYRSSKCHWGHSDSRFCLPLCLPLLEVVRRPSAARPESSAPCASKPSPLKPTSGATSTRSTGASAGTTCRPALPHGPASSSWRPRLPRRTTAAAAAPTAAAQLPPLAAAATPPPPAATAPNPRRRAPKRSRLRTRPKPRRSRRAPLRQRRHQPARLRAAARCARGTTAPRSVGGTCLRVGGAKMWQNLNVFVEA